MIIMMIMIMIVGHNDNVTCIYKCIDTCIYENCNVNNDDNDQHIFVYLITHNDRRCTCIKQFMRFLTATFVKIKIRKILYL
jgi:hypothetical protein